MRIGGLRRTDGCVDEWLNVSVLQSPHKAAGVGGVGLKGGGQLAGLQDRGRLDWMEAGGRLEAGAAWRRSVSTRPLGGLEDNR